MSRSSSGPALLFFGIVHGGTFALVSRAAFEALHGVLR